MTSANYESCVRGAVMGVPLGDAVGAPFEFRSKRWVIDTTGGDWIDGLYHSELGPDPYGVWEKHTPPGTGTDDTRLNWVFLNLASDLGRMPTWRELGDRFAQVGNDPGDFFPSHPELAKGQFGRWESRVAEATSFNPDSRSGVSYPGLGGLITLTCAGLLFPGQPDEAYLAAYRADFFDIGYAREAVAVLAGAISLALTEDLSPVELMYKAAALDPLGIGHSYGGRPYVRTTLPLTVAKFADSRDDYQAARDISHTLVGYYPYDAFKTLAVAVSAVLATDADPWRSILVAVNHTGRDVYGNLDDENYQDIDCYGAIAGALAGAISGVEAFPPDALSQVTESNKSINDIDLDETIQRFLERFG